jgi:hypothetical protein
VEGSGAGAAAEEAEAAEAEASAAAAADVSVDDMMERRAAMRPAARAAVSRLSIKRGDGGVSVQNEMRQWREMRCGRKTGIRVGNFFRISYLGASFALQFFFSTFCRIG